MQDVTLILVGIMVTTFCPVYSLAFFFYVPVIISNPLGILSQTFYFIYKD